MSKKSLNLTDHEPECLYCKYVIILITDSTGNQTVFFFVVSGIGEIRISMYIMIIVL